MKKTLFEVKTIDYDTYYVWANDFQDAYLKLQYLILVYYLVVLLWPYFKDNN